MIPAIATGGRPSPPLESSIQLSASFERHESGHKDNLLSQQPLAGRDISDKRLATSISPRYVTVSSVSQEAKHPIPSYKAVGGMVNVTELAHPSKTFADSDVIPAGSKHSSHLEQPLKGAFLAAFKQTTGHCHPDLSS